MCNDEDYEDPVAGPENINESLAVEIEGFRPRIERKIETMNVSITVEEFIDDAIKCHLWRDLTAANATDRTTLSNHGISGDLDSGSSCSEIPNCSADTQSEEEDHAE